MTRQTVNRLAAGICGLLASLLAPVRAGASSQPTIEACALLAADDIARVQQTEIVEQRGRLREGAGVVRSSCFVRASDFSRSVSLELTGPGFAAGTAVEELWRRRFHGAPEREEHEAPRLRGEAPSAEPAEERPPALAVDGLGEEAYWVGTAGYGALFVLEGERFLRISVGGPGDQRSKLDRAEALARLALLRMRSTP